MERVDRNPFYRPAATGDIPGADNAVVRIRLDEGGTLDPASLRVAEITAWATPDRDGAKNSVAWLDELNADREQIVSIGKRSREVAEQKFDVDKEAGQFEAIIQRAVAESD